MKRLLTITLLLLFLGCSDDESGTKVLKYWYEEVDDWSFLANENDLCSLTIRYGSFPDSAMNYLGNMKKLEYLDIQGNYIKDISMLSSLPHLKYLNIENTGVEDLRPLSGLQYLEIINAYQAEVRHANLKDMPSLRELHLRGDVVYLGLIFNLEELILSDLPSLERIDVGDQRNLAKVDLRNMPKLNYLDISGSHKWNSELKDITLQNLPALDTLDLERNPTLLNLGEWSGLENVRFLDLSYNKALFSIEQLSSLESLEKLHMLLCENVESVKPLSELKKLRFVDVHATAFIDYSPFKSCLGAGDTLVTQPEYISPATKSSLEDHGITVFP